MAVAHQGTTRNEEPIVSAFSASSSGLRTSTLRIRIYVANGAKPGPRELGKRVKVEVVDDPPDYARQILRRLSAFELRFMRVPRIDRQFR
jgi:hypothetical protein